MKRLASILATAALVAPVTACVTDELEIDEGETVKSEDGKTDASALAVFLDMEFQGTLLTDSSWNDKGTIEDQLLYTVGHLNGDDAVGRIDRAVITNIQKTSVSGKTQIKYTVKLPVAWRKSNPVPATYQFQLPKDISSSGQTAFATKYSHDCVDLGAHDVDAGSMFYYFRPDASRCNLAEADVMKVSATVKPSPIQTTGKYPEYNKMWEDGVLKVVAIFGKYEDGATTASDAGVAAYNTFIASMKTELGGSGRTLTTVPATVPSNPGVGTPDIEFNATLPDGKKVHVVALLTDNVRTGLSQSAFRSRYETLSTRADYIVYNGHAGLGTNVRALAQAGKWVAGQYVVVYMNGCDTFAYIDDALNTAHKNVNPDDTTGYKYVDIVNNALPAFFASMSGATMSLFRGFLSYNDPKTYEQMMSRVDSSQLVLVVGEQDNQYTPGGGGTAQPWSGMNETGTVNKGDVKKYSTPTLAAGKYLITMTGSGGDADLYVQIGREPTTTSYTCRPYKTGSNETCEVTLPQSAALFVQVRGYSGTSTFKVVGKKN
ncbi:MAG: PPC domain-containing protein [Myxococcales bacterium]|nr:PPC domain-containing protein [Myxococcales bacterium]